jgi:hypothetical protein
VHLEKIIAMADIKAWFHGSRKIWFAGLAIAMLILWVLEYQFFVCHPSLQLFLRELAFAVLISCLFGLTIEQIQRTEFIRLVTEEREVLKRDVFLYAYGSNLPDEIRKEMRDSILDQPFYRHDVIVDWEFSIHEENHDLMEVKKRYSYRVVNNSNVAREWPFTFVQIGADDLKAVADSHFGRLRITRTETTEYLGDELKTERPPDQPHTKRMSIGIKVGPQESIGVYYEVGHVRRLFGDDRYNSKDPIIGTTKVRLRFPPDFEVQVACKTRPLKPAPDNDPPTRYSLEWAGGMLPFTGVTISWSRKEKKGEVPS